MEYEDTNILRTQYVDDLVNQRQALEDAILYQNAQVLPGEGLDTMVPKVQSLTGSKPSVPYFSNYGGLYAKNAEYMKYINFYNWTNFDYFASYSSFNSSNKADLRDLAFSNIITARYCFQYARTIYLPSSFRCENIINAEGMFDQQNSNSSGILIENEEPLNFKKLEIADYMFRGVGLPSYTSDKDIKGSRKPINITSNRLTSTKYMFHKVSLYLDTVYGNHNCRWATLFYYNMIKNLNVTNVKTANYMFGSCSLTLECVDVISNLNFENLEDAERMFSGIVSVVEVDEDNFSSTTTNASVLNLSKMFLPKVKNMNNMFSECSYVKNIIAPSVPFGTVTNMYRMFRSLSNLVSLDISRINMESVTDITDLLSSSPKLENVIFGYNLGKGYTNKSNNTTKYCLVCTSTVLTRDSAVNIINRLYDLNITYGVYDEEGNPGTGKLYTQKLDLDASVINQLTPEEIAVATNKGWTVV